MTQLANKIKKLTLQIEKLEAKTKPLKKKLKQLKYDFNIKKWARNAKYDGFWIWKQCYHFTLDKNDLDFIKEMVKHKANINYVNKQWNYLAHYGNTTPLDWVIKNSDNKKKYIKELRKLGAKTSKELTINNKN